MAVRVAFGANWKSSGSVMFLMALATCITLFMKAILRQMSCAQTETRGSKEHVVSDPGVPSHSPDCRTL